MKRSIYLLIAIIVMLLITSCSNKSETNNKNETDEAEQPIDYKSIFESVSLQDKENYKLQRITSQGTMIQPLGNNKILISKDSNLVIYDSKNDEEVSLAKDVWNSVVSMDKTLVAYENDEGIHVVNLKDQKSNLIYPMKDEITRNFIISKNSKEVVLQTIKNDKFYTKVIDMQGKSKNISLKEDDDFVLTNLVYFEDDKLYATAQIMKERYPVQEEELIKTTDLVMVDLNSNNVKNITKLSPEDQTYLLDIYEDKLLIEVIVNTINEEGINAENSIKRVNFSNGILYSTNIKVENSSVLKLLSDEKEYVYLERPEEIDVMYPDSIDIKYHNKKGVVSTIGSIHSDVPSTFFIQDNSIYFNSNGEIYIIAMLNR